MYSQELISEICSRNDIVDYISQYVQLKKSGRGYSGLCPFHSEKSPSFHVSPDKQLFHCFGCGAGGNLIQFVMRAEGLDFRDSLKSLADRAGMVLPEDDTRENDAAAAIRKKIWEMNKAAARFYFDTLTKTSEGHEGLRYFSERRIRPETIKAYGLGFAPEAYDALYKHLLEKGYSETDILEAGLISKNERGNIYDRFRGRVIFPIIDVRGNVIGFGGRIMDDQPRPDGFKPPKYLNSAQTPAFDKGKNLFSLNLAKMSNERQMILAEGYMDVISVYQAGIKNIVATLGTALTDDQARLLNRYSDEILICYDSDDAGKKAALRAIDIISGIGGKSRVIRLKGAKDPDEYIKANGVEAFREALKKSIPATEFKLSLVKSKYNLESTDGKVKFVTEAADALSSVNDVVEVDAYISRVAEETQISREAIYSEYKKKAANKSLKRKRTQERVPVISGNVAPIVVSSRETSEKITKAERDILRLSADEKRICRIVRDELSPGDFTTNVTRTLAKKIYESWENGNTPDLAVILAEFSDSQEANEAAAVFVNQVKYENNEIAVRQLIKSLKIDKVKEEIMTEEQKGNGADFGRLFELHRKLDELKRQ